MELAVAQDFWNLFSDFIAQRYPIVKDSDQQNVELGWKQIFRQIYECQRDNSGKLWPDFRRFLEAKGDSVFVQCANEHFSKMLDAILLQKGPIFSPGSQLDSTLKTYRKPVIYSTIPQITQSQAQRTRFAASSGRATDEQPKTQLLVPGAQAKMPETGGVIETHNIAERASALDYQPLKSDGQTSKPDQQGQWPVYPDLKATWQDAAQFLSNPDAFNVDFLGVLDPNRNLGHQKSAEHGGQAETPGLGNQSLQDSGKSARQSNGANFELFEAGTTGGSMLPGTSKSGMPAQGVLPTAQNAFVQRKFEPGALPRIPEIGSALLQPLSCVNADQTGSKSQESQSSFQPGFQNASGGQREDNLHLGMCMQFQNSKAQALGTGGAPSFKKCTSPDLQLPALFEIQSSTSSIQVKNSNQTFQGLGAFGQSYPPVFSEFSTSLQSLNIPTLTRVSDGKSSMLDSNASVYFSNLMPANANQLLGYQKTNQVDKSAASGSHQLQSPQNVFAKEQIGCFSNTGTSQAKASESRTNRNANAQQIEQEFELHCYEFSNQKAAVAGKKPNGGKEKQQTAPLTWADVAHYRAFNVCGQQVVAIDYQPFNRLVSQDFDGRQQAIKRRVLLGQKPASLIPSSALRPISVVGKRIGKQQDKMAEGRPTAERALGQFITPQSSSCNGPSCRPMKRSGGLAGFDPFCDLGIQPFFNQLALTNCWRVQREVPLRTGQLGCLD